MRIRRSSLLPLLLLVTPPAFASAEPKAFVEGHRVLYGIRVTDLFGIREAVLPDVNGDGIDDLAVGAFSLSPDSSGALSNGDVAIHSGANGARLYPVAAIGSTDRFADSIADVGDVDADGTHDFAIGTVSSRADSHRGTVRVYSGRSGSELRRSDGETIQDRYGARIIGLGDLDGDGAPEMLVAAPRGGPAGGRLYLHSGRTGTVMATLDAPAPAINFGGGLARLGDVDGDRIDDFMVGAPTPDSDAPGIAYVYSGANRASLYTLAGPSDGAGFGINLGSAGDFDRDGRDDFFEADPSAGGIPQTGGRGRLRIYSGRTGAVLLTREGAAALEQFGRGATSADFNGDGFSDLAVSRGTGAGPNAGSFDIYAGPDGRLLASYTNTRANERIGTDLATMGDVDGDGRIDLMASPFGLDDPGVQVVAGTLASGEALTAPAAHHTGLWVDTTHDGEGFVLEMLAGGEAAVYWFTYGRDGAQRYLLGLGRAVGTRLVFEQLLVSRGGGLGGAFDPASVQLLDQSRLVLSFDGCGRGHAEYTVDGERGRQRLARLSGVPSLPCGVAADVPAQDYSGSWYDSARPGEGWIVQAIAPDRYAVLWFSFDATGRQQWFTALTERQGTRLAGVLLRPLGGRFGRYFDPAEVSRPVAGSIALDFDSCERARVTWQVDAATGNVNVARLTSPANLRCTP